MRRWSSRRTLWLVGAVVVVALVVLAVLVVVGRSGRQQANDPRATNPTGAGALGVLLAAEGVEITTVDEVDEAVAGTGAGRALVVANADRLDGDAARRLLTAGYARVILLQPGGTGLAVFGAGAETRVPGDGLREAGCPVEAATLAGPVLLGDAEVTYAATGPADFSCYAGPEGDAGYLRVGTAAGPSVELVAGAVSNDLLDDAGNAAFGMNVFGGQPELTWLMARPAAPPQTTAPSLLPPWWPIALAQAAVAFLVVAVWRGRRLGPIMVEPLPVTVRAAETVEGHGRLYHRLDAYDRAAAALRAGAVGRLSRAFGHAEDPLALSAAVADQTGADPQRVRGMLVDARPTTDDALVSLARDLDRLEQEARRL